MEEYDGTSWTEVNDIPTARKNMKGAGTLTDGLAFGGIATETIGYDGTSWSTRPSLATQRGYHAGFGTSTAALAAGNRNAPDGAVQNITEEFTGETTAINLKTITDS